MTGALTRKGVQLDLDVWQEAQHRITQKQEKLLAKKEYRRVTMSEVIEDAFRETGWKKKKESS